MKILEDVCIVSELAGRHECDTLTVFKHCLEIYSGSPDHARAARDHHEWWDNGQKTPPFYVVDYHRKEPSLPDDYTQRSIRIVQAKLKPYVQPFVKSIRKWFD